MLSEANFSYFGTILHLQDYRPKERPNQWKLVRKNFTNELTMLNLQHTFKVIKKACSPGSSAGFFKNPNEAEGERLSEVSYKCVVLKPGDKFQLGVKLFKAFFLVPDRTQLILKMELERTENIKIDVSTNTGFFHQQQDRLIYQNYTVQT